MTQKLPAPQHRIYLLAIWEEKSEDPDAAVQWRFSLEHPASGQRRGFTSLAALTAALQQLLSKQENR